MNQNFNLNSSNMNFQYESIPKCNRSFTAGIYRSNSIKNTNSIEERDKKIDDAIKQVEAIIEVQTERIKKDEDRIEELEKSTKTINENLNKFNKATSRNAVYKLANELIAKQWMSQSDYESLQELSDVYMKSGDSHYVIPNIIQRALNLPVLTDEEIEAKMSRHRADFKL